MEREHLENESKAETPLPDVRRATSIPKSPPQKRQHAPGRSSWWTGAGLAMNPLGKMSTVLKRYGLALVLASLALFLRGALPLLHGIAIYQLPIAAVVLSAWYGGRGPSLFAALICATGTLYFFIPPVYSFELHPDHALGYFIFLATCLLLIEFSAGRQRAAQALRASEDRFRTFSDVAADALMVHTEDGTLVDVNPQACESLGYTREELIGMKPADFDAGLDQPGLRRVIEQVESGEVVTFESQWRRKNGTTFSVEVRGRQFRRGNRWLGVSISRDITERKRAEAALRARQEELRASEARFRTFVDRATDAFFLMDEQLRVVDVNRQACESMGWSREEFIGMHPRQFDMGLDEPSIEQLSQRAAAGEIITFETRHRRKDGSAFPVEIRTGTFMEGAKLFYLAIARDISERKQAEERQAKLAAIVESSDDAIISKDLNGIITTWNAGAERIFGYAAWEVIGQSVTILLPPDRVDEVRAILQRIRRGERVHHFETVRRRKDGTLLDISLTVSPIIDESGNIVGASKVARDISERKRAEDALRKKDDALEMARTELARVARLTTLGELTTSIAHEVSQPLGAMVASAGAGARWLAADPPAIAEARAALDNIVADGKRAREVIARIRTLTKRQAPSKDRLDINQKVVEVLALTEHELRSHDIVLRTELDRTLPRVAGDRIQLQQVLLNLIVNAVEAMSAVHDRTRELTIVSRQDGSNAVVVEVRDSGNGLDAQRAEQVFEAFYTTKAEGIGIGLSISRSIIEAHGGRLWASANAPHGAIFRFSLPVAQEAVA